MKFPLPLNVLYHYQTTKLGVETMAEPLHTWLKDVYTNHNAKLLFGKTVKVIEQREASHNFL